MPGEKDGQALPPTGGSSRSRASMILQDKSAIFQDHASWLKQRAKLANVRQAFKSKYSLNELGARFGT
jgi:hypothetical protein